MNFGFSISDFLTVIDRVREARKLYVRAPKEFQVVADDLRNFSNALEDISVYSESEPSRGQLEQLEGITKSCNDLIQDLQKTLDKYTQLQPSSGVGRLHKRVWKKLTWDPAAINGLRSQIGVNLELVNVFLAKLNRSSLLDAKGDMDYLRERQDTRDLQEERRTIATWISEIEHGVYQSSFIKEHQAGTGQWLLDTTEFMTWVETDKRTLFCPGIPGAGKTILTAVVIDHLTTRFTPDPTIGIAYIYCNFKRKDEQAVEDLLAILLSQLVRRSGSIPKVAQDLYNLHRKKGTRPSLGEISRTLQSVVATYSRVFIIVDALDELQTSDISRRRFMSELFDLQSRHRANIFATSRFIPEIMDQFRGSVELEILARSEDVSMYLADHMEQLPRCVQRSQQLQEDIKAGISGVVDGMFLLARIYLTSLEDKYTPRKVRTALHDFKKQSQMTGGDKNVEALTVAYRKVMEKIHSQNGEFRELANRVLSWITCASRPLSAFELQEALAVEVGERELGEDNMPPIDDMISVCAGLVTVDEESQVIRLVHYTTQEYFESTRDYWFPDAESEITRICATYLSFDVFNSGSCDTYEELDKRLESNKLYEYASCNWAHHALKAPSFCEEILGFLECHTKAAASSQTLKVYEQWLRFGGRRRFGLSVAFRRHVPATMIGLQMTGLHLAIYAGAEEAVKALINLAVETGARDSTGRTPISYAAKEGHRGIVELLLNTSKVDIDSRSDEGRTPLSFAAKEGHIAIVDWLLDTNQVDINSKNNKGRSSLSFAAEEGHRDIVQLLLDTSEVDIDSRSNEGRTPLSFAAQHGYEVIVKLLLRNGANLESKETNGMSPLSWAARGGHAAVVTLFLESVPNMGPENLSNALTNAAVQSFDSIVCLLLENVANIEAETLSELLSIAASKGIEDVVKLLVATNDVHLDFSDDTGKTPLSLAAKSGNKGILEQLIATDKVELDSRDDKGLTPLSHASREGHEAIVDHLIATDNVELDSRDSEGLTPLSYAARYGHGAVVELLLRKGAFRNPRDCYGWTPLLWAARRGYRAVAQLLANDDPNLHMESLYSPMLLLHAAEAGREEDVKRLTGRGVSLVTKDQFGQTPLSFAAAKGHLSVVKFILNQSDHWLYLQSKDLRGRTALHCAIDGGIQKTARRTITQFGKRETVVQMLLNSAIDIGAQDNNGRTSLHSAIVTGNEMAAKLLVSKRVVLDLKDNDGRTPLSYAVGKRHTSGSLAKLLLENGAQPDSMDHCGRTVLSYAVRSLNGTNSVLKLLLERNREPNQEDHTGRSLLSYAAGSGNTTAIKLLLDANAEPNSKDHNGRTPLSYASQWGSLDIVNLLQERNGDPNQVDCTGRSPLSYAAESFDGMAVKALLEKNAEPNKEDSKGRSPLSYAAGSWNLLAAKPLLERNAEINSRDYSGRTPLSYAAQREGEAMVKYLLDQGAEPDTEDHIRRTPLSYAAQSETQSVARLLAEKEADLESMDKRCGWTPLMWAAISQRKDVIKFLLQEGAVLDSEDNIGRTAVSLAARYGHKGIAQLLSIKGTKPGSESLSCTSSDVRPYTRSSFSFCDICRLGIPINSGYHCCRVCEDFDICSICFEDDPHCLDKSHELERLETKD